MLISSDRNDLLKKFLNASNWADADRITLAGDASNRNYERLIDPNSGNTAVLMNAPPEKGEDVRAFVRIARHLTHAGFSAPCIYQADNSNGLLLLEDLGDALFSRIAPERAVCEQVLYTAATDVLVKLHKLPVPGGIAPYSPNLMAEFSLRSYDWYLYGSTGTKHETGRLAFQREITAALEFVCQSKPVLALRDFHSENLIWLPERSGVRRVGLLDFQDAMSCHPAYDLASLLHDARRDVAQGLKEQMIDRYVIATQSDKAAFELAFSTLSAQRNLRIIGGFARLSLQFGKPGYLKLLPRVWGHLLSDLEHPKLAKLRNQVLKDLPSPTESVIKVLKDKCATIQTL